MNQRQLRGERTSFVRASVLFVALVVVVLTGIAPVQAAPATAGRPAAPASPSAVSLLAPGITLTDMFGDGPVAGQVVHIAPDASARLQAMVSSDRIDGGRETTSSMCRRTDGLVCVNASFPVCFSCGQPFGGVVRDGTLLRNPTAAQDSVSVRDGQLSLEPWAWFAAISGTVDGKPSRLEITGVNVSQFTDGLVLYSSRYGARTGTAGGIELVISIQDELFLNHSQPIEILDVRFGGNSEIEPGTAVLSGQGAGGDALLAFASKAISAEKTELELDIGAPADLEQSVSGHPILIDDGDRRRLEPDDGKVVNRHPRTLLGWNDEGDTWIVVVDGRQARSVGMTLHEATDYLLGLGATYAVNLDGGGSSTMVTRCDSGHCVRNQPSDGGERRVWTTLVVTVPVEYRQRPAGAPISIPAIGRSDGSRLPGQLVSPSDPEVVAADAEGGPDAIVEVLSRTPRVTLTVPTDPAIVWDRGIERPAAPIVTVPRSEISPESVEPPPDDEPDSSEASAERDEASSLPVEVYEGAPPDERMARVASQALGTRAADAVAAAPAASPSSEPSSRRSFAIALAMLVLLLAVAMSARHRIISATE